MAVVVTVVVEQTIRAQMELEPVVTVASASGVANFVLK
jgi:hypothetical protein